MNIGFLNDDAIKVLISAALGAIIGLEREWSGKSAGFRTMMLVCMGATLFTIVSHNMARQGGDENDATRIASNVATGIGFIGAGLIFRGDRSVHGLTTAATVWAAAAIGMAVAIGNYTVALATTMAVWVTLVLLYRVEKAFVEMIEIKDYQISMLHRPDEGIPDFTDFFDKRHFRLLESKTRKEGNQIVLSWSVRARKQYHQQAIKKMVNDPRIMVLNY
jgi:putative Mg2+ transporter-C (MgtC) family protein